MAEKLQTLDFTEVDGKIQKGEGLKTEVFQNADTILAHLRTLNEQLGTKQEGEKFEGLSERLEVLKGIQASLDVTKAKLVEIKSAELEPDQREEQWLEAVYSGMDEIQKKAEEGKKNGNEVFFTELSRAIGDMVNAAKESKTLEDDLTLPFSFDYSILKKRVDKTEADLLREGFPAEDVRADIRDAVAGILAVLPVEDQKQEEAFKVGASLIGDYKTVLEEQARLQQALDMHAQELGIDKAAIRQEKEAEFRLKLHGEDLALLDALAQTKREQPGAHRSTELAKKACKDHKKHIKVDQEKAIRAAIDEALKAAIATHDGSSYQETIKGLDLVDAKLDQLVLFMRSIADVCLATRAAIGTIEEAHKNGSAEGSTDANTAAVAFMKSDVIDKAIEQVEAIRPAGNDASGVPAELIDVHQLLKDLGYEGDFNMELMKLMAKYPRKEGVKREPAAPAEGDGEGKGEEKAAAKVEKDKPAAAEAKKPGEEPAKPADPKGAPGEKK